MPPCLKRTGFPCHVFMKQIKFSQIVAAMKTAQETGHPHATLYRSGDGWSFGAIGSFTPLSEEYYLLPIMDRTPDRLDDEFRAIAAAWVEGEYGDTYPLPPDLKVKWDDEIATEEGLLSQTLQLLNSVRITISKPLPCHLHDELTEVCTLLIDVTDASQEEGKSIPGYTIIPLCPKCIEQLDANLDSLDAIDAVRKMLDL